MEKADFSPLFKLIQDQVEQYPERIAAVSGDNLITFAELNRRSNRLAHFLRDDLGCGEETAIGVRLERSIELLCALLAVMKIGASYVPVDPAYPVARQAYMLEDSRSVIVICDRALRLPGITIPELNIHHWFKFDSDLDEVEVPSAREELSRRIVRDRNLPQPHMLPCSRWYIMYTSGSTGKPKGVMGSHEATLNRFEWMWRSYPFTDKEVVICKTSICFVDSVWEMFGAMAAAAKVVMAPLAVSMNVHRFTETCQNQCTRRHAPQSVLFSNLKLLQAFLVSFWFLRSCEF
jgi:surfactin family lipopeptide synthetase A